MSAAFYFITGANGFIGASLCRSLCRQGHAVTRLVHRQSDHPFLENINGKSIIGDVLERATYQSFLDETTRVVHCAGNVSFDAADQELTWRINCEGTRDLLETCIEKKVESVLFISAAAVFRPLSSSSTAITEQSPLIDEKANAYARSKAGAEELCLAAVARGLRVVIVNPVTTYGGGDFHLRAGGRVVDEILRKGTQIVPPGGTSWIDIDDLVDGVLLALEHGRSGQRYILSAGNLTYLELFSQIAKCAGRPCPRLVIPKWMKRPLIFAARSGERFARNLKLPIAVPVEQLAEAFGYKWFCSDKAERELGFRPKTTLWESIKNTMLFNDAYQLSQKH